MHVLRAAAEEDVVVDNDAAAAAQDSTGRLYATPARLKVEAVTQLTKCVISTYPVVAAVAGGDDTGPSGATVSVS